MTRSTDAISTVLFLVWFSCLLGSMPFITFVSAGARDKKKAQGNKINPNKGAGRTTVNGKPKKKPNNKQGDPRSVRQSPRPVRLRNTSQMNGGGVILEAENADVLLTLFWEEGLKYVKQGFASEAGWEIFFHVAMMDNLTAAFGNVSRERKIKSNDKSNKSVDFFFQMPDHCVALEVKVEIKKVNENERSYAGKKNNKGSNVD